jgi:hypothetical protein
MDGFRVDDAAIHAHARTADELAGRMTRVAEAGRPLDLGAYGLIGQVFAGAAVDAAQAASTVVRDLAGHVEAMAGGIRATGAAYQRVERENAARFGGLR